ncbi:MAG: pirin family protein [Alphaproteobacteria bacterium]|nr:pirin family protein [Alphaproteobacteria bacterium]
MITLRPAAQRGRTRLGWLDGRHSFSFGGYYDSAHVGFAHLLVINDDRIAPGGGFGTHGHSDMEIVTYMLEGRLAHRDSLGNGSTIAAGEAQRMSAGTGIRHSEFNASKDDPARLLQIWIEPGVAGLSPGYEERPFTPAEKRNRLCAIAAPDRRDGAMMLHQDAVLYAALLEDGGTVTHGLTPGRHAWLQVATGTVTLNGLAMAEGDGAAITGERDLTITAAPRGEVLLFDLA